MKPHDEHMWACLDGEMTPAEAAQYDRFLSAEDHGQMASERELERGLGEMLARPAPGADEAWRAALARVGENKQARRAHARWRRFAWAAVPAAIAAMALVVLGVGHARTETQPPFLSVSARDAAREDPPKEAQEVMATARNMLRDRDMHMAFDPMNSLEAADAPCRLVAVHGNEYAGEQVVELSFMCGGQPSKVIIANGSGRVAHEISRATARGAVLASRSVGDWLVTAVGANAPDGLLSLIEEAQPVPEETSVPAVETQQAGTPIPEVTAAPEITPEIGPEAVPVAEPEVAPQAVVPETAPEAATEPPATPPVPEQAIPAAA